MKDIISYANTVVNMKRVRSEIACKLLGHDMHEAKIIKSGAVYLMACARCGKQYIFYQQLNFMAEIPERKG